jgi:hypothetical protein
MWGMRAECSVILFDLLYLRQALPTQTDRFGHTQYESLSASCWVRVARCKSARGKGRAEIISSGDLLAEFRELGLTYD